mgnify:CR=1 FL=1
MNKYSPHLPPAGLAKTAYLLLFLFTMSIEIASAETLYTDLPTGPGLILEDRANARHRSQVVPAPLSLPVSPTPGASLAVSTGSPRIFRAALLARVFALDVTRCPACGGGLRPIADGAPPQSPPTLQLCASKTPFFAQRALLCRPQAGHALKRGRLKPRSRRTTDRAHDQIA